MRFVGTGKGTYSTRVAKHFGLTPIAAGDLVREVMASGSKRGQEVLDFGHPQAVAWFGSQYSHGTKVWCRLVWCLLSVHTPSPSEMRLSRIGKGEHIDRSLWRPHFTNAAPLS